LSATLASIPVARREGEEQPDSEQRAPRRKRPARLEHDVVHRIPLVDTMQAECNLETRLARSSNPSLAPGGTTPRAARGPTSGRSTVPDDREGGAGPSKAFVAADDHFVAFDSTASNLAPRYITTGVRICIGHRSPWKSTRQVAPSKSLHDEVGARSAQAMAPARRPVVRSA
jgi:hypothetical protein